LLHQVGDLFELSVKLRCLKVNINSSLEPAPSQLYPTYLFTNTWM